MSSLFPPLHSELRLLISGDSYTLISSDAEKPETLSIDRVTNTIHVSAGVNAPSRVDKELVVYGLFGIVQLLRSDYLVVITKRKKVATVLETPIYSATDFSVFPLERSTSVALLGQPDEAYLLGLLKAHLYSAPFYFTYGGNFDVTTRLQYQKKGQPLFEAADDRFFWNRHLQRRLIDSTQSGSDKDCSRFILPVIFGFLEFKETTLNGRPVLFGLISRRSRYRAGTRYFSRGIDRDGNVSNFNETEQILILDAQNENSLASGPLKGDIRFSYVQTRGSVPVYWAEINNLRYKPDLKIMDLSSTAESLRRHFDNQLEHYGDQYLVNLVNQKGYEKPVKDAYERAIEAMGNPRVHYTYFDFHHECKGLRFDRVSVLIDSLDEGLQQQGYYHLDTTAGSSPQKKQTSVVRTNCMDCLDRTNVVQSQLAKWVLNNQLRQVGILSTKESIDEHPAFLHLFRNVWADNADVVSRAYSGTGALKTDYTRTGKRSKEGALQDGVNSIVRYIKNNYLDGPRQDAYDLVTGAWVPRKGQQDQGWKDERAAVVRLAPWFLLAATIVLLLVLVIPQVLEDYVASTRKLALASIVVLAVTFNFITARGIDYVSRPKLVSLDDVLNYNGKGYESGRRGRPAVKRSLAKPVSLEKEAQKREVAHHGRRAGSVLPNLMSSSQGPAKQD